MYELLSKINFPYLQNLIILSVYAFGAYIVISIISFVLIRKNILSKRIAKSFKYILFIIVLEYFRSSVNVPSKVSSFLLMLELLSFFALCYIILIQYYITDHIPKTKDIKLNKITIDIAKFSLFGIFLLIILRNVFNVNLSTILTPSAILTAIIGLSMQDTIGNLISGLIIQMEKPYEVGDWIQMDNLVGEIKEINWRHTKIKTIENIVVIVPNSSLSKDKIVNLTKPDNKYNFILLISAAYDAPPTKVKRGILDVISNIPSLVLKNLNLKEYADSAVIYELIVEIEHYSHHRDVRNEIYSGIWYKFKELDIEIPFPMRSVIIRKDNKNKQSHSDIIENIRKFELFSDISSNSLERLAQYSFKRNYKNNDIVINEGDKGESMFFVLDGFFNVIKKGAVIGSIKKGEFFGEMSLLTGEPRSATIISDGESSTIEIDRHTFKLVLNCEKNMVDHVEAIFSERVKHGIQSSANEIHAEKKLSLFDKFKSLFGI